MAMGIIVCWFVGLFVTGESTHLSVRAVFTAWIAFKAWVALVSDFDVKALLLNKKEARTCTLTTRGLYSR